VALCAVVAAFVDCALFAGSVGRRSENDYGPRTLLRAQRAVEDLKPVDLVSSGEVLSGTVSKKVKGGVLMNIGYDGTALLRGTSDQIAKLKIGEELEGLRVQRVNQGKIDLDLPNLAQLVSSRKLLRVEDFKEGDEPAGGVVSGWVGMGRKSGIFLVDVGAEVQAALMVNSRDYPFLRELRMGDRLTTLRVEKVDTVKRRIQVSMDLAVARDMVRTRRKDLMDLDVGSIVSGEVVYKKGQHVELDIGCWQSAILNNDRKAMEKLAPRERISGLRVQVIDLDTNRCIVTKPGLEDLVQDSAREIEDLESGQILKNAIVIKRGKRKNEQGQASVLVDAGLARPAILYADQDQVSRLRKGDLLNEVIVRKKTFSGGSYEIACQNLDSVIADRKPAKASEWYRSSEAEPLPAGGTHA
jgi:predicted RNA-binding protein (virulence factor B family)